VVVCLGLASLLLPPATVAGGRGVRGVRARVGLEEELLAKGMVMPDSPFPEAPWRPPELLDAVTIASSKYARFEVHKIRAPDGTIINDWLWADEGSHVNVLIHMADSVNGTGGRYMLMEQTKYGLDGDFLALVGGFVEPTDPSPAVTARREVLEEAGFEVGRLVDLGSYRVCVNRGGGYLYAFLALDCVPSKHHKYSDDLEKQRRVFLTRRELLEAVKGGRIGEAQWAATAALALLHE